MHPGLVAAIGRAVGRRHGLQVAVIPGEGLGQGQMPVGLGVIGLDGDGLPVARHRLVKLTQSMQSIAEILWASAYAGMRVAVWR